ncbi:hypothetical protein LCGC14_0620750 [marine sediment metagenome]|uniref:4-vinyl reductase 4VR domain-containing protein n=1 Tax=marine sediment metagenome TaxID=412755 RepID=A0A0F9TR77_9ZZZZ|nr:MAG: hypothetical protein Lokiarch_36840 [Candidatus Lokiarchaeum sp. GC14_75]
MAKYKDALKFFHAYIHEMIDVGGPNLPKSISASLGAKLGKILKNHEVTGVKNSLKMISDGLKAKTKIKSLDDEEFEVLLSYKSNFCPLGGEFNPDRSKIIQTTICVPYITAILNTLHSDLKFTAKILDCILNSNEKICRYKLTTEEKKT